MRQVFIISDLHLGGASDISSGVNQHSSKFQILNHVEVLANFIQALANRNPYSPTELVINGDFIDFLAEETGKTPRWVAFEPNPQIILEHLERIFERNRSIFDALRNFISCGHLLTLLLGNHDLELSLPLIRRPLEDYLTGGQNKRIRFIYDGEAYIIGNALIEHGNRYDPFNVVDHDALRRFRSLQSRHQSIPDKYKFSPPVGSYLVATVINHIKEDYPFINLLKPETGAVVPLLLTLEPRYRSQIITIARYAINAWQHRLKYPAMPRRAGDICSQANQSNGPIQKDLVSRKTQDPEKIILRNFLLSCVRAEIVDEFLNIICPIPTPITSLGSDISSGPTRLKNIRYVKGLTQLIIPEDSQDLEKRILALHAALLALKDDRSFDDSEETSQVYLKTAYQLASNGIRYVIFGHTHLAKSIDLGNKRFYLNTGTWANIMRFPTDILLPPQSESIKLLQMFIDKLSKKELAEYVYFRPTYVRLDVIGTDAKEQVVNATLCEYQNESQIINNDQQR